MTSLEYRKQYLIEIEDLLTYGNGYTDLYVNCIMTVSERKYALKRLIDKQKDSSKDSDFTLSSDSINDEQLKRLSEKMKGVTTYNTNG